MFNAFITSLSVFVSSVAFQSENWDRFQSIMPWASSRRPRVELPRFPFIEGRIDVEAATYQCLAESNHISGGF